MSAENLYLTPSAAAQLELLSSEERDLLIALFSTGELQSSLRTTAIHGGRFVSKLGSTKRILWQNNPKGEPIILSIVDHSFAQGLND